MEVPCAVCPKIRLEILPPFARSIAPFCKVTLSAVEFAEVSKFAFETFTLPEIEPEFTRLAPFVKLSCPFRTSRLPETVEFPVRFRLAVPVFCRVAAAFIEDIVWFDAKFKTVEPSWAFTF